LSRIFWDSDIERGERWDKRIAEKGRHSAAELPAAPHPLSHNQGIRDSEVQQTAARSPAKMLLRDPGGRCSNRPTWHA
jgi:hypothetical protein